MSVSCEYHEIETIKPDDDERLCEDKGQERKLRS